MMARLKVPDHVCKYGLYIYHAEKWLPIYIYIYITIEIIKNDHNVRKKTKEGGKDGKIVGCCEGDVDGSCVGRSEGCSDGEILGYTVGTMLGSALGCRVGCYTDMRRSVI